MSITLTNFLIINGSSKLREALNKVFIEYKVMKVDYRLTTVLLLNVGADIDIASEFEQLHDKYYESMRC